MEKKLEQEDNNSEKIFLVSLDDLKLISSDLRKTLKLLLDNCNYLIENNYLKEASILLDEIIKKDKLLIYKVETSYLINKIKEANNYNLLTENNKLLIDNFKSKGRQAYKKGMLVEAIDYYKAGLYVTELNEFNYYLGKIYYKLNFTEEAKKYFKEYLKEGASKYTKAKLYISRIYLRNNNYGKANSVIAQSNLVSNLENSDYLLNIIKRKRYYNDKSPKILKKIKMKESDFNS